MESKVDVIIPAYLPKNQNLLLLNRALKSLEEQTYKNFHVHVVLNGLFSPNEEIIPLLNYGGDMSVLSLHGKTSGAIARNYGIKSSNSPLIAQLDADDQYHPEKLMRQVKFMEDNLNIDFVGCLASDYYPDGTTKDSCFMPGQYENHDQISKALLSENVMCHSSVMFRRSSFEKIGGYVEIQKPGEWWPQYHRRMWEDWDLWLRAINSGLKIYNIPERLYYWSVGTSVER
jgi:glycosyltransferase involved in cell wall biosynthesis